MHPVCSRLSLLRESSLTNAPAGGGPLWELCIDSFTNFSAKQYSRQVFNIYGGLTIIRVIVIESGHWESMQNRTKLIVELVDNGGPSVWSLL
jgi:hypothetical protein